ncbi:hypothetical protein HK405_006512 [Cladochytrium tenue]|nr:hypothetical protein HK405_006512 [Cladochytrium tenue]
MSATAETTTSSETTAAWDALVPAPDGELRLAHNLYLLLGAFVCAFGLVSLLVKERLYMSEAMVALLVGVAVGPSAAKVLVPADTFGESLSAITFEFSRIVIAIQCMAAGVDLPGNYLWKERLSLAMLLGPLMVFSWLVSALGLYLIIGVPFLESLVIAACLTPTDPVLANSIVKGRFAENHIPLNVRLLLSAESGANDGLGTPFLMLAIYLRNKSPTGVAIGQWFYRVVLYEIGVAVVLGVAVAYLGRKALKFADHRGWIDKESLLSFSIALALLVMGIAVTIGVDDILSVFVAGNVLTWDLWFNRRIRESHFQEVIDALLNLTYFVYIGCLQPWSQFGSSSQLAMWRLVVLAGWMLLVRRLPAVVACYKFVPALKSLKEAFFAGVSIHALGESSVEY